MSEHYIYSLRSVSGDCLYIGQTTKLPSRLAEHRNTKDFHDHAVLAKCQTVADANKSEVEFIRTLRPPLNKNAGGGAVEAMGETTISFTCTRGLRDRIEKAADAEHRSTSNYLRKFLSESLKR